MRRTRFDDALCPVARTTDLLGDWWTPLVLRELLLGRQRFNDIQERTGMSRAILSRRLERLADEGVVVRAQYEDSPPRFEYRLTAKGVALWEVVAAMWRFGDDWLFDESPGAAVQLVDKRTGDEVRPRVVDEATGEPLDLASTRVRSRR
jgi:DNA-binding HxlR family transcriptional regulator